MSGMIETPGGRWVNTRADRRIPLDSRALRWVAAALLAFWAALAVAGYWWWVTR